MERLVDLFCPLGDAIWFREMKGSEALSTLFEYDLLLHSKAVGLDAKEMLGQSVTLAVETEGGCGKRYFNGICTRFGAAGREGEFLVYQARLRAWLWLAGRRSDCKIFQFMKVTDIVREVLRRYGQSLRVQTRNDYRTWDYCVQYQETDLNFVMRLMEHEGIHFHFEHQHGSHTLVLSDEVSCHSQLPGKSTIQYFGEDAAGVAKEEHFNEWDPVEQVNSGEYISDDYDFENPRADLKTKRRNPLGHYYDFCDRYEWPGGYVNLRDGEDYAAARLQELQTDHKRAEGQTTVRTMATGYLFTLKNCYRDDQNGEYLCIAANYYFRDNTRMSGSAGSTSGKGESTWKITVTAQSIKHPYRPPRITPKPRSYGPQTAVVVGPPGREIHTDRYGRVKVQFFWDRDGKKDERSSCWIRVSQPWAGENWGFIHLPRIGQEVIVDFIGGDPDYPIITGRVYNAECMPPYELPKNETASGIKSHSTQDGGGAGFNEIRMEDKQGSEQLYLHAQRNLDSVVEASESRTVGDDRNTRIGRDDARFVVHDDHLVVNEQQNLQVGKSQNLSVGEEQHVAVGTNQTNAVGGHRQQVVQLWSSNSCGGKYQQTVGAGYTLSVGEDQKISVGGAQTNLIKGGRKSVIVGRDTVVSTAKITHFAAEGYNVCTPTTYNLNCLNRKLMVLAGDQTDVVASQTLNVGATRSTTVVGADNSTLGAQTTTVAGVSSLTAGGAVSITAATAASITAGATASLTGATITLTAGGAVLITAPTITLAGIVNITGMLNVAGTIITPNIVSATYSPGVGNLL